MGHFNQGGVQMGRGLEHPGVQCCSSDAPGQFWPQLGIDSSLLGQLEMIPSRKHRNGHRAPGIGSLSNYFNGITCQWTAGSQVEPSFLTFWNFSLCPDLGTHQEGVQFQSSDSQHAVCLSTVLIVNVGPFLEAGIHEICQVDTQPVGLYRVDTLTSLHLLNIVNRL